MKHTRGLEYKKNLFDFDYNNRPEDFEPGKCCLSEVLEPLPEYIPTFSLHGPEAQSVLEGLS